MLPDDRHCQGCGASLDLEGPVGRRDACDACGADLHACVQCRFYDLTASNQCREPQADRVADKTRGNFCELFQMAAGKGGAAPAAPDAAKAKLEALFKR